jgi:hypothetical protein
MNTVIMNLRKKYALEIESPFCFEIEDQIIQFDCLVKGYGASKGMVVDSDWNKIESVSDILADLGYGYSCFEIDASSVEGFDEVLDDWGKVSA